MRCRSRKRVEQLDAHTREVVLVDVVLTANLHQLRRRNHQSLIRREDNFALLVGNARGDFSALRHNRCCSRLGRNRKWNRQSEGQLSSRTGGWLKLYSQEIHEADVVLVGNQVQPIGDHFSHPREHLDQRDAWVTQVVIRPLRAISYDAATCLIYQIFLESQVVENGFR